MVNWKERISKAKQLIVEGKDYFGHELSLLRDELEEKRLRDIEKLEIKKNKLLEKKKRIERGKRQRELKDKLDKDIKKLNNETSRLKGFYSGLKKALIGSPRKKKSSSRKKSHKIKLPKIKPRGKRR